MTLVRNAGTIVTISSTENSSMPNSSSTSEINGRYTGASRYSKIEESTVSRPLTASTAAVFFNAAIIVFTSEKSMCSRASVTVSSMFPAYPFISVCISAYSPETLATAFFASPEISIAGISNFGWRFPKIRSNRYIFPESG